MLERDSMRSVGGHSPVVHVALLWKDDYPWDVRVEKFARTLASEGYRVSIIAGNSRGAPDVEILEYADVYRLHRSKLRTLDRLKSLAIPANPAWVTRLYSVCQQGKVDILIVRDIPLALSAIVVGRLLSVPVILDMAENYPGLWQEVISLSPRSMKLRVMKNPGIARIIERYLLKRVAHVFVVVEESRDRLLEMGVASEKISIVSNTPALLREQLENHAPVLEEKSHRFVLLYHGYINRGRGLRDVLEGLVILRRNHPDILVKLIGIGDQLQELKQFARTHALMDNIAFLGWIEHEAIADEIRLCDAGIIPHIPSEHKNTTIPNKLFDFMLYGKPVVVSNTIPLKRIVEEERCGVVFSSGKPLSFACAVEGLLSDPNHTRELGERGADAVVRRYNWGTDGFVLKRTIGALVPQVRM